MSSKVEFCRSSSQLEESAETALFHGLTLRKSKDVYATDRGGV
jgi:hypothetical protein